MNQVVVEMAVPVPAWVALLIAGAFSGFLMFFAHSAGSLLRQMWSEISRSFVLTNVLIGSALLLFDIAGVLFIVALRGYFLTFDIAQSGDLFETATTLVTLGLDALPRALSNPEAVVLGTINAAGLVVALLAGIFTHDTEAEYHERYVEQRRLTALSKRAVERYERRQTAIFTDYVRSLNRAVRAYVGNGGSVEQLPRDDFKAQRLEAESVPPPPVTPSPAAPRPLAAVPSRGSRAE